MAEPINSAMGPCHSRRVCGMGHHGHASPMEEEMGRDEALEKHRQNLKLLKEAEEILGVNSTKVENDYDQALIDLIRDAEMNRLAREICDVQNIGPIFNKRRPN